jgi:hypothetical protein
MWKHLWARGVQPWPYMELVLCRDIYHCTPTELAQQPLTTIAAHLTCLDVEAAVRRRKTKHGTRRS